VPGIRTEQAARVSQPLCLPTEASSRTGGISSMTTRARKRTELRLPAIEVRQGANRTLYTFAVDGKQLPSFATVSRVHRDDNAEIQGYQRPEVLSHIASIRRYLESSDPMIPNALV